MSRSFSPLRMGTRAKAQRNIGGIAMVVMIAMVTMMVKRSCVSAPIERPMLATITSVEPRAFIAAAERERFAPRQSAQRAADEGSGKFAEARNRNDQQCQEGEARALEHGQIGGQSGNSEEYRHEERQNQAAQLLVHVLAEDWGFPDQHAGDESAQNGVNADEMRCQRHQRP